jgi:hypothetical protein
MVVRPRNDDGLPARKPGPDLISDQTTTGWAVTHSSLPGAFHVRPRQSDNSGQMRVREERRVCTPLAYDACPRGGPFLW